MTRHTIVWVESAIDDLARFWMKAADRQAIADAADLSDKFLVVDPAERSEPLSEGLRAVTVGSLRLFLVLHDEDRKVEILYVKRIVREPGR
jgi:hypothetical protein